MGEGGDPHGKFIILSFSDDEDAIFANTVTALASVADFSTVAASADAPLLFGSLQIDPQRRLVWQSGQTGELTPMEFDIVWLLCENANKVVDTEQLFETVWKEKYLENNNNTVMAHVARIREKMHEVPRKPKYIKTVWGVGYKIDE